MIEVETPVGPVRVEASTDGIIEVAFGEEALAMADFWGHAPATQASSRHERAARRAIERYFAGDCTALDEVELDLEGHAWTPLRRRIYEALRRVPVGETTTYAELARAASRPGAARAAGSAMSQNKIPLFIPCHRVLHAGAPSPREWIAAGKSARTMPVGSFGPGPEPKRILLEIEARSALAGASKKRRFRVWCGSNWRSRW